MPGVLYSFVRPSADEAEAFFTWYEAEHVTGRLSVPGFLEAHRYRALDGSPTGLLLYELESLDVLQTERYRAHQAATAATTAARLGSLDRFVRATTDVVDEQRKAVGRGRFLFVVAFPVPPDATEELDRWYREEHAPMLLEAPGWRGYRLLAVDETNSELRRIALHELDDLAALDSPERAAATSTSWRGRLAEQPWFGRNERHVLAAVDHLAAAPAPAEPTR